jgi:molecular chaperone DnaK (HSP70)
MADKPMSRKRASRSGLGPTISDAVRRVAEAARDAETSDGPHNIAGVINVGGEGRVTAVQRQQVVHVRRRPDGTSETVTKVDRTTHGDNS